MVPQFLSRIRSRCLRNIRATCSNGTTDPLSRRQRVCNEQVPASASCRATRSFVVSMPNANTMPNPPCVAKIRWALQLSLFILHTLCERNLRFWRRHSRLDVSVLQRKLTVLLSNRLIPLPYRSDLCCCDLDVDHIGSTNIHLGGGI